MMRFFQFHSQEYLNTVLFIFLNKYVRLVFGNRIIMKITYLNWFIIFYFNVKNSCETRYNCFCCTQKNWPVCISFHQLIQVVSVNLWRKSKDNYTLFESMYKEAKDRNNDLCSHLTLTFLVSCLIFQHSFQIVFSHTD